MSDRGSYVERLIDVTIELGEGDFGAGGSDTVKLSGLRVIATINRVGTPSFSSAEIRIFGVRADIMNRVSTLGIPLPMTREKNIVTVEAGDERNGMAIVYRGYILNAWQNLEGSPETFLHIISNTGAVDAMKPVPPISFPGSADVATIMSGLAIRMDRKFENNGVQVTLSNPYFPGTAMEQAQNLARAANIEMLDEGPFRTLAIWPKNRTRGGVAPLISVQTGMIGYPYFRDQGLGFRCIYNPSIRMGGKVVIRSSIGSQTAPTGPGATLPQLRAAGPNGEWYVFRLTYSLSSKLPGGPWFCECEAARIAEAVAR